MHEYDSKKPASVALGATGKRCSGPCGRLLPTEAFVRGRNSCKACRAAYHHAYYEAHRQQVIERAAAWGKTPQGQAAHEAYRAAHKAEKAIYDRAYRAVNAVRIAAYQAAYRAAHHDQLAQGKRAYHRAHAPRIIARVHVWQKANPERFRRNRERYRARHPEAARAAKLNRRHRMLLAGGRVSAADVRAMQVAQRGRCVYCLRLLGAHYHLDHMTAVSRGGCNDAGNLALSCGPCNRRKATRSAGEWFAILLKERRAQVTV